MASTLKTVLKSVPPIRSLVIWANRALKVNSSYQRWIKNHEQLVGREEALSIMQKFMDSPLISIVVPVYDVAPRFLEACIASVHAQYYENWELCIADDASKNPRLRALLNSYAAKDKRIKTVFRKKNGHIAAASNSALELSRGDFVAFLDNDDVLEPSALFEIVATLDRSPQLDLVYSDVDNITASAWRSSQLRPWVPRPHRLTARSRCPP